MNWTDDQLKTIETRGKNMLISAAAGSGKTAVLVERILRLILEDGISIDNILVVTFTNAAAAEMKDKIVKAIKKKIIDEPETREHLSRELEKVPNCSISTFHSFSLNLIKKYFYVADLNPNLKILDDTVSTLLRKEAIDSIFEEIGTEKLDLDIEDFVKKYGNRKNDEVLKEVIIGIYNGITSIPDYKIWLENIVPEDYTDENSLVAQRIRNALLNIVKKNAQDVVDGINRVKASLDEVGLNRHTNNIDEKLMPVVENFIDEIEAEDFVMANDVLSGFKFPVIRAKKEEASEWEVSKVVVNQHKDYVKDKVSFLKSNLLYQSIDDHMDDLEETRKYMADLRDILLELDKRYSAAKRAKNGLDFSDIEHFAIELLKNEDVANECREKYEYIFIDEYQDSNYIQETIIGSIKRPNNVFMVGDIKQSIYGFRMAEPDIFKGKYSDYSEGNVDESVVVDLNLNFRSKENVIDTVNTVFANVMDGYTENQRLNLGASYDKNYELKNDFIIIEKDDEDIDYSPTAEETDMLLAELKSKEIEALEVVNQINRHLGETYYDHKAGCEKKFSYGDMIILFRNLKQNGSIFYNTLIDNGIPAYVDSSDGFFDSIEVITLIDILRVIDNSKNDIALLSALRSFVFGFTIDQLAEIRRVHKTGSFEQSFRYYEENGPDDDLRDKITKTLAKLDKWKEDARYTPIDEFLWQLLEESSYTISVSAMPSGEQRKKNIFALVDKATMYRANGDSGIYGFLEYLEEVKKNIKVGKSVVTLEDDNVVQITTIHKSKGLEYPIVILPYLNRRPNLSKGTKIGDFDKDYGFSMALVNDQLKFSKKTFLQTIILDKKNKKEREEEIRILYVALTRAKDKLIMIGTGKDEVKDIIPDNTETYFNLILSNLDSNSCDKTVKTPRQVIDDVVFKVNVHNAIDIEFALEIDDFDDNTFDEVSYQLDYQYPYEDQLKLKSKFSVSELNNGRVPKLTLNKLEDHLTDSKRVSFVRKGQIYHLLMEKLDFARAKEEGETYISSVIDTMIGKHLITEVESKVINLDIIKGFFETNVGSRAAMTETFKEQPFTMVHEMEGKEVLVQGIIDCFFEEDGEIVLIDYKTNRSSDDIYEKYHTQMELYKEAIEKSLNKRVKESYIYLFQKGEFVKF